MSAEVPSPRLPVPVVEGVLEAASPRAVDPAALYLADLAEGPSRETMARALVRALVTLGRDPREPFEWAELRYPHLVALKARLEVRFGPATVAQTLTAVRQVLRAAWLSGLVGTEEYHRACAVRAAPARRLPAGRALSARELQRLLAACRADRGHAGARDAALVALLAGAGLRRAEATGLGLRDWAPAEGALRVRGKGGHERLAYAAPGARAAIEAWRACRGPWEGPLVLRIERGGEILAAGLTPQAVRLRLSYRARAAGIGPCSPHDLRRTFISSALAAGADLALVQRLAGHVSPATTALYDRRPDDAARAAASLVSFPYDG